MATSSFLGVDADNLPPAHSATGIDSLGPSDASDSGSDSAGAYSTETDSDTDRFGTGERGSVDPAPQRTAQDILPDHVEDMEDTDSGGPGDDNADPDDGMQDEESDAAVDEERGTAGRRLAGTAPLGVDDLTDSADTDDEEDEDAS